MVLYYRTMLLYIMAVIKSYDKLVTVLDFIQEHPHIKLQDLADGLNMSKSTLHRIVTELVEYSFLSRDSKSLTYKLGTKLLEYGNSVIEELDIRSDSSDIITELNRLTKETVHLAVLVDERIVYVDKRESQHAIRMYSLVGKEAPVHCTGVGKAILAFLEEEMVEAVLKKHELIAHTEHTITDRKEFYRELEKIREEGVAFDREEHENGIICIAAPIRNYDDHVLASISITSITNRMTIEKLKEFKKPLLEATNKISRRLGCRSGSDYV